MEKGAVIFIETTSTIQTNVSFFEQAEYNIGLCKMTSCYI